MSHNAENDAPVRIDLHALYEKVEQADSRYVFPFDAATTKATLLLLIRRVQVAEAEVVRLSRQYDSLVDEYEALEASIIPPAATGESA